MFSQFILGGIASTCNIAIHSLAMTIVIQIARLISAEGSVYPRVNLTIIMIATVLSLMIVHASEIIVWALVYGLVDAAPNANSVYFAFVNYTTLGYGDVIPVERWQLLGPMAAMNGVLLFGWSTAVIFEVLRRALRHLESSADQNCLEWLRVECPINNERTRFCKSIPWVKQPILRDAVASSRNVSLHRW